MLLDLARDVFDQLALVALGQRVALDEALREADDADLEAARQLHVGPAAVGDLDAAAADVDDYRAAAADVHAVHRREVDEARFLRSGDDARTDAGVPLDFSEEFAAVFGLARGARGRRDDLVHAVRLGQPLELREGPQGGRHCLRCQGPPVESARSEAHHRLLAVDDLEGQIGPHLDHDHVDRIRSDVDGRDTHQLIARARALKPI